MKNYKSKIILLGILIVAFVLVIFLQKDSGDKDFIDLRNAEVFENESSVNNIEINNKEFVQVRFSWEVNGIKYNDALNFTKDQYAQLNEEDIEKMKEERFTNWAKSVNYNSKQDLPPEFQSYE